MSGGEQQMLALGRALMMSAPRILLVDEPSVGLAPMMVQRTIGKIGELQEAQRPDRADGRAEFPSGLRIADRGYVMVHGQVVFAGQTREALSNNELIREFYLGL